MFYKLIPPWLLILKLINVIINNFNNSVQIINKIFVKSINI